MPGTVPIPSPTPDGSSNHIPSHSHIHIHIRVCQQQFAASVAGTPATKYYGKHFYDATNEKRERVGVVEMEIYVKMEVEKQ